MSVSLFGESHGPALGCIVDGFPSGIKINQKHIQQQLDRRKPGQSKLASARKEPDRFEIISGIFEGKSTGAPICILIRNIDAQSKDYDKLKDVFRPSHADYVYEAKYGIRDHRGGGRSSARITAPLVAAGALANQLLKKIKVQAYVHSVGNIALQADFQNLNLDETEKNPIRCPDADTAKRMIQNIEKARLEGDSLGGVIACVVKNVPIGLGEPWFEKLNANLAKAMMSINAAKGFEIGSGFDGVSKPGSLQNDLFEKKNGKIITLTNNSGGIQGGISNGMDIFFKVAFKAPSSISIKQPMLTKFGKEIEMPIEGRHDPCVLPRAVPIVEALASLVIADHLLLMKSGKV